MVFPADCKEWDEAVCAAYPVNRLVIESEGDKVRLFSFSKQPVFFTNAPYLEEGGIYIKTDSMGHGLGDEINSLLDKYGLRHILLKSRNKLFSSLVPEENIDNSYYTFILDTTVSSETIWADKLASKTRNQIRKAEKKGFTVKFGGKELLSDFYKVISRCWRDLGTPVHDQYFFQLLLDKFGERASLIVLFDQSTPVSTAFLFNIDGVLTHPFAGTLNSYKPTSVNNHLYWNIIKYACDTNISIFDMGRSRLNQGTYKFKESWGGVPEIIYYYYFMNQGKRVPTYDTSFYKVATKMWKYMPLPLANKLGPKLIYKIL